MKTQISALLLFVGVCMGSDLQGQVPAASPNAPEISFEKNAIDIGTVAEGAQPSFEFKFKNTGKEPLVLDKVQSSCGCAAPEWSKEPIKPGQTGTIKVVYNSNGRPGTFTKTATVMSNVKTGSVVLTIKGNVTPAQESQSGRGAAPTRAPEPPSVLTQVYNYIFG